MKNEVIKLLRDIGALVENGHFVGTSGRHMVSYINKNQLTAHPRHVSKVGKLFAEKFRHKNIEIVVAPAVGGIPFSQWTASHLYKMTKKEVFSAYTEKTNSGKQTLKRGYDQLVCGKRVLVIEDTTTTGGSVKEVIASVKKAGGKVGAAVVMRNRDPKLVNSKSMGVPFSALATLAIPSWPARQCQLCKNKIPISTELGHG